MIVSIKLFEITLGFIGLDLITGFTQAAVNHCIDSKIMKDGLFHKCGFILAIVLACLCEYALLYVDLGFSLPLQESVCAFIIFTELVSNLENLAKINPELGNSRFFQLFKSSKISDLPDSDYPNHS